MMHKLLKSMINYYSKIKSTFKPMRAMVKPANICN